MRSNLIVFLLAFILILGGCGQDTNTKEKSSEQAVADQSNTGNAGLNNEVNTEKPTEPPMPEIDITTREAAVEALEHDDLRVRWKAVRFLRSESENALEDLTLAIDSKYEDVASAAVGAISVITGPEEGIPILVKALDHEYSTVRTEAVIGLGNYGKEAIGIVSEIESRMGSQDARFQEKAAESLKKIKE